MKRLVLPLVLVLVAAAAWAVWQGIRPASGPEVDPTAAASMEAAGAESEAPVTLDEPGSPEAGLVDEVGAEATEKRLTVDEHDLSEARREGDLIRGLALRKAECSGDDALELILMPTHVSIDFALSQGAETLKDKWIRTTIAPDGSFEVVSPDPDAKHFLMIVGRTAYLDEPTLVKGADDDAKDYELACGAWIGGTLELPEGEIGPIDFTQFELEIQTKVEGLEGSFTSMRRTNRKIKANADGSFAFRAVPAGGPYSLSVSSEVLAFHSQDVRLLKPGEEHRLTITLKRGGRITGLVVDEAGAAVPDADVAARVRGQWFGFDNREVRDTETGPDGRFTLEAVTPGEILLKADAEGYLDTNELRIELTDGGTYEGAELELSGGRVIAGHLKWPDGRPAPGIEVDVSFDRGHMMGMGAMNALRGAEGEAETGPDGAFRVTGLGKGPFELKARAAPEGGSERWVARANNVQPGTEDLLLELQEPIGLSGRVVDHTGKPVPEFRVEAYEVGEGLLGAIGAEKVSSSFEDAEGRFLLEGLQPRSWNVFALAEGFAVPTGVEIAIPHEGEELVLEIFPASTAKGFVRSPAGDPIAGATVKIDTGQPAWQAMLGGKAELPSTVSTSDGSFTLENLQHGTLALSAEAEGFARSEAVSVDLDVGQTLEQVTIMMRTGATLTGEVYDKEGELSQGQFVQVTQMATYESQMAFTDDDGAFSLEHLEPGTWQVVVMPPNFSQSTFSDDTEGNDMMSMMSDFKMTVAELVDEETTHVVLGAEPSNPVKVSGHVMHDGEPYAGALVTFYAEGENVMETMRNTQVEADGSYSSELARPGQYVVQIQKLDSTMTQQRIVEFSREIPETEELELDFEIPTGRISGRVEGSIGEPLVGVRVSLHPEGALETGTFWGGQYAESQTDEDGKFDFQGLRPGKYNLLAGGMPFGGLLDSHARYGRAARTIKIDEGQWLEGQDFELESPSSLKVNVVDASGKGVSEAAVFVRDEAGRLLDRLSVVTTDGSGSTEYGGLSEGSYTVSARKAELASLESVPLKVGAGEQGEVTLRMEPGTVLLVTLTVDGGVVPDAMVSVTDPDGREVGGMMALSEVMQMFSKGFTTKEHRIGPLPPGRYRIEAETKDGRKARKPVTLSGKAERKVTLRFK